ncbi:MAG: S53 family peptidase, partial [Stenotrophobium sp.]
MFKPQFRAARGRYAALICALALAAAAPAWAGWDATSTHALPLKPTVASQAVPADTPLHIIVSLKLQNPAGLQSFLQNQHTPGNPQYGVTLTPAQFAAAYSPSAAQAQAVADYLASQGFSNIQTTPNRTLITADGSAAIAQNAFNTALVQFQFKGKTLRVATQDVQVPSTLGGVVLAVLGLQDTGDMMTNHQVFPAYDGVSHTAVPAQSGDPTTATLQPTFTPDAFRKAYDAGTTPEGANTTVAIISGGTDLSQVMLDLRQAERDFKLPYVPVSIKQVGPVPTPQVTDNDGEWDLDSQSSSGIAGNVKQITFYNGTGLDDGITLGANKFATDNTAKALNISIGGCESVNFASGTVATDDQAFMQAEAQGQTVFVSSGDAGAACGVVINLATPQGGVPQQVEYPASSPFVVAVGGTSLFTDANFNYATETAWNAGGGGNSLFETAPSWQAGAGVLGAIATLRGVPDVSMNAGFILSPAAAFYSAADTVVAGRHEAVIGTS